MLLTASFCFAQQRRKIIIDEDCSGPAGSNLQTVLLLIQSPKVEVLGITVVTGDAWRDEELKHTLRLLEIIGRTDIPVLSGAAFPLLRTRAEAQQWQEMYGRVSYSGAWDPRWYHEPFVIPDMPEGKPSIKPAAEDAAHFLVRAVRQYPNQVTIYGGGPMTNLAMAMTIEPRFAELADEFVFMGGSLNPQTADPEFANNPRHEFNFWFDPEAAEIVLRAPWRKIVCTPTDISIKTKLTVELVKKIEAAGTPAARYLGKYFKPGDGNDYMWDELAAAAWIDPSIITRTKQQYMSVDVTHGPGYGNTILWSESDKPRLTGRLVEIQVDLDGPKFYQMFSDLLSAPTPKR
jgi:inosine-uridine nucleoside N-ribohydrolase